MTRLPLAIAALALLTACSPDPGSPAWTAQQAQKKDEARAAAVKTAVDEIPSWYSAPSDDEYSITAPGTAASTDLQFALDKAVLAAKRSLADRLNSKLSAKIKEFVAESGAAEGAPVTSESERTTTNLISEVNLTGYAVKEQKLIPSGGQYRAYVLLQYPLGRANRLLVEQVGKDAVLQGKLRASKAFQELEAEIAKSATAR